MLKPKGEHTSKLLIKKVRLTSCLVAVGTECLDTPGSLNTIKPESRKAGGKILKISETIWERKRPVAL